MTFVGMCRALLVVGGVALVGCGDAATDDDRGYTKAPLEEPGLTIEAETATPMDALGEPILRPSAREGGEPVVPPGGGVAPGQDD